MPTKRSPLLASISLWLLAPTINSEVFSSSQDVRVRTQKTLHTRDWRLTAAVCSRSTCDDAFIVRHRSGKIIPSRPLPSSRVSSRLLAPPPRHPMHLRAVPHLGVLESHLHVTHTATTRSAALSMPYERSLPPLIGDAQRDGSRRSEKILRRSSMEGEHLASERIEELHGSVCYLSDGLLWLASWTPTRVVRRERCKIPKFRGTHEYVA